jgi:hypothetical protein
MIVARLDNLEFRLEPGIVQFIDAWVFAGSGSLGLSASSTWQIPIALKFPADASVARPLLVSRGNVVELVGCAHVAKEHIAPGKGRMTFVTGNLLLSFRRLMDSIMSSKVARTREVAIAGVTSQIRARARVVLLSAVSINGQARVVEVDAQSRSTLEMT